MYDPGSIMDASGILSDGYYSPEGITAEMTPEFEKHLQELEDKSSNPLPRLIRQSPIYKQAYQILSSDTQYGKPYLVQLEMIPTSFDVRDQNTGDDITDFFGGTSGREKLIIDAFNAAMDEIRVVVQSYYTFRNSLPAEQVSQLADAGINAAITGEGITPSSMPQTTPLENPQLQNYDNASLSSGITSFVEFIGSLSGLASTGFNAASLMGMLDLAEREGYSKQEIHDYMLAQLGITTDSPYRVLNPSNTPVVRDAATVAAAETGAKAGALRKVHNVNVGNNPDKVATYEKMDGFEVLNRVSEFALVNRFADGYIELIRRGNDQVYADVVSRLDNEYQLTNYAAMASEAGFNDAYFKARNGTTEGRNTTSISESLAFVREQEQHMAAFEAWLADYKAQTLGSWAEALSDRPSLAPYLYKAMFDFGMEDTFYHQNAWTQGLKYGMDTLKGIGNFLVNLKGLKTPPPVAKPRGRKTETVSTGPKGTTVTTSYTENID